MRLSDWTDEEVAVNRTGKIADSQRAKLRSENRMSSMVFVVLLMVAPITIFSVLMFARGFELQVTGVVLDLIVLGFGITMLVRQQRELERDLSEHALEAVSGVVVVTRHVRFRNKDYPARVVSVGGRRLRSMVEGLDRLEGETVTVYVLSHSQRVFAVDRT